MQMNNIRRQGELSKKISRNNAEISVGIMDSWNRRSNAFDRMSSNYSQAVRGVDSYTGLYGNTVECDVELIMFMRISMVTLLVFQEMK